MAQLRLDRYRIRKGVAWLPTKIGGRLRWLSRHWLNERMWVDEALGASYWRRGSWLTEPPRFALGGIEIDPDTIKSMEVSWGKASDYGAPEGGPRCQ